VDGHAPGLRGKDMLAYVAAGISTDHECFTLEEALEKLQAGMKILIREGSAAKNFEALIPLLTDYPDMMMFCSDDKHPDSLLEGHINLLCQRAIQHGIPLMHVLKAACINPVKHYNMKVGLLQINDPADFIVVKDFEKFEVLQTYINGQLVAQEGKSLIESVAVQAVNQFDCEPIRESDIEILWEDYPTLDENKQLIPVIEALEGQLITNALQCPAEDFVLKEGKMYSQTETDTLKIVVVNRYKKAPVAKAFIRNFGFKSGAIASSLAHDSHNIIAVGVSDADIVKAVNLIIEAKGGVSVAGKDFDGVLALPVAGLMSAEDGYQVAEAYTTIDALAKSLGSPLAAPFMTLSFMALLVIPYLKLSDKGLFDGGKFRLM
jgi:adenine deaminase